MIFRYKIREASSVITVELCAKLSSEICVCPIRWISFVHESNNLRAWLRSFPLIPHPTKMIWKERMYYSRYKTKTQYILILYEISNTKRTILTRLMEHWRHPNEWRYLFCSHHTKLVMDVNLLMPNLVYIVVQ